MNQKSIKELFETLRYDRWRNDHSFSKDLAEAHAVLHAPFVWRDEAVEVLNRWCQGYQPCIFGKYAAKHNQIHIAPLFERDLYKSDKEIAARIAAEKRLWKQRAVDDTNYPPHGFLLVVL